jgi:serine/threonine-protein kinase
VSGATVAEKLQLPPLNEKDSVAALIATMTDGLRHLPSDQFNDNYIRIRAILRRHPLLKSHLPEFLVDCATVADFRSWMAERFDQSFEWDAYLSKATAQLAEHATSGDSLSNYEIKDELGRGGFGRIFLAEHKLTQRPFAIKVYYPAFHDGGGSPLSRFFQEAGMLYELKHPNIITVREIGLYHERPFIVMDYFRSVTLNRALIEHGRMPPEKAIAMIEMITSALRHAHEKNIVHRDLTPGNILLAPNDCRVIDFGLGVYVEQTLRSRLTQPGEAPAGGNFTARELLTDPTLVDPRSDIFSIGALWYHAVTNDYPAGAELADSLTSVEGLPDSHQQIIVKCLLDIKNRYQSCAELQESILDAKEQLSP